MELFFVEPMENQFRLLRHYHVISSTKKNNMIFITLQMPC